MEIYIYTHTQLESENYLNKWRHTLFLKGTTHEYIDIKSPHFNL